jgi:hypothetical protein
VSLLTKDTKAHATNRFGKLTWPQSRTDAYHPHPRRLVSAHRLCEPEHRSKAVLTGGRQSRLGNRNDALSSIGLSLPLDWQRLSRSLRQGERAMKLRRSHIDAHA